MWLRTFAGTIWARRLVLILFIVQAMTLVFITRIGTPPDETNHIKFIEYYANHSLSPFLTHQTPTYNLGDKTREVDYVYHYTMSFVYRGLPLSVHGKYLVIRTFSVLFALLAFLALAKLFRKLGISEGVTTVSLLILTNLPMVLMMSSAINNDVFVWLGMVGGLLLLMRLWERPALVDLLWLASLAFIGGLVKRDLLPIGLLFGVLGLVIFFRHFRLLTGQLKRFDWRVALAIVAVLVCAGLFIERVGVNVARYGTPTPSCNQVQGAAACSVFWGNIREAHLNSRPMPAAMPIIEFVPRWIWSSVSNIVDIQTQGWRHVVKPARWLTPLLLVVLLVGLLYALVYERKRFRDDTFSRYRVCVLLIALYYVGVQMVVNYSTYRKQHAWGLALNGRYIIPSILLLGGFASFYWSRLLQRYPRTLVVLTVVIILSTVFGSGLLMMLNNYQLHNG
ncbi:MAG TPA: hypothetical protein VHD60_01730 [Candidatus Saccharimonadales bacterium]|nr:hypothetical protein [Candidatus Saccharimonadales bacterium]